MLIPIVIAGLVIEVLCIELPPWRYNAAHSTVFLMYSTAFVAYLLLYFLFLEMQLYQEKHNISKNYLDYSCFSLVFRLTLCLLPSNDIFGTYGKERSITWDQSLFPTACIFKPGTS